MQQKMTKISEKSINSIIEVIMADDNVMNFILALVDQRITPSMHKDTEWCCKVIDLSIEQVFKELEIVELIKSIRRNKSKPEKLSSRSNTKETQATRMKSDAQSNVAQESSDSGDFKPAFSSTEPVKQTSNSSKRHVKQTLKALEQKRLSQQSNLRDVHKPNTADSVHSSTSTVQIVQDNSNFGGRQNVVIEPKEELFPDAVIETNSVSSHSDDLYNCYDESVPNDEPQKNQQRNKFRSDSFGEEFLSSWEKKVLSGMKDENDSGTADSLENSAAEGNTAEPAEVNDSFRSNGMEYEGSDHPSHINRIDDSDSEYSDEFDNEKPNDDDYSSDGVADIDTSDYFHASPVSTLSSSGGVMNTKGTASQILFFDQSRFDADADYFASQQNRNKTTNNSDNISDTVDTESNGGISRGRPKTNPSTGSPIRVRFAPKLISDIRYRDRVGYFERGELFFTHDEEYQFTLDQTKEAEKAEAMGLTWMEWMEQRSDEDLKREEQEWKEYELSLQKQSEDSNYDYDNSEWEQEKNPEITPSNGTLTISTVENETPRADEDDSLDDFKLYSGDYFEEGDEQLGKTITHNFKIANAHANMHTNAHIHESTASHDKLSSAVDTAMSNDELSVPNYSESDSFDEYEF